MGLSVLSAVAVYWLIPVFQPLFIKAGLFGIDMSKIGKQKVRYVGRCACVTPCTVSSPLKSDARGRWLRVQGLSWGARI
jgi:UDP-N-acetylmuramyl pentapeptide phosphotransferase/UDP-N-acetylglucosamine-1-phosphate transferase